MAEVPRAEGGPAPPLPDKSPKGLQVHWNKPLHQLVQVEVEPIAEEMAERHRIYSLLTLALVSTFWNGNKKGAVGNYPWREAQKISDGRYQGDREEDRRFGDRYIGHNIACIAVDENGEIVDFDFNHNELYNSSAEHAEGRLVRRIFSLNNLFDHWQTETEEGRKRLGYSAALSATTIYTSLESCAQCSGIMALGNLKRVVYLQSDPGQYLVGNMLYNLTRKYPGPAMKGMLEATRDYTRPGLISKNSAPEPIDASLFGFEYKQQLEQRYLHFAEECGVKKTRAFFVKPGENPDYTDSLTSFLCTDDAMGVFDAAAAELKTIVLKHGTFRPNRSDAEKAYYSNSEALGHARSFLAHAANQGNRGTPHR